MENTKVITMENLEQILKPQDIAEKSSFPISDITYELGSRAGFTKDQIYTLCRYGENNDGFRTIIKYNEMNK